MDEAKKTHGDGKITEVISYRLSATGIWKYEFRLDGERIGSVTSIVSPTEPVRIEGPEIQWYSRFDFDPEIVPGVSRRVKDNKTGEEFFRIVWWRPNLYEVRRNRESIQVEIRNGCYLFGLPMMPVTAMTERTSGQPILLNGREAECWFRTMLFDPVSPEYMMMVLSFPALRFC